MVDAADHEKLEASRNELHGLLEKPQLAGIPVSSNQYVKIVRKQVAQVLYAFEYKTGNVSVATPLKALAAGFHRWAKLFELNL